MKNAVRWMMLAALVVCGAAAQEVQPGKTTLKVGDIAPDFTLTDTDMKPVKLSDFRGKKNVLLAFFPAAFTGG
jgi:peroxiredoxin